MHLHLSQHYATEQTSIHAIFTWYKVYKRYMEVALLLIKNEKRLKDLLKGRTRTEQVLNISYADTTTNPTLSVKSIF